MILEKHKVSLWATFRALFLMLIFFYTRALDTFFSGKNGARMILCGSNDLFVQAESNDTHYDHDLKIFGSRLGQYVPYPSNDAKSSEIGDYEGFFFSHILVLT